MAPGGPDERAEGLIEGILGRGEQSTAPEADRAELLTFLIADIRGYTAFTQARGDEAAAKLTAKFATLVRGLVTDFGGTVFELRGDEALCVLSSPRQCLRLAVALQQRFVEETVADPELPLPVGIGIDSGEAVRGADGYRGGALNLAARLCGQAKPGQVLASAEATHLARTIDGLHYAPLDRVVLKGLAEPIRPVRVYPDGEDPAQQMSALLVAAGPSPSPTVVRWLPGPLARRPRLALAAAVCLAALIVASVSVVLTRSGSSEDAGLRRFRENSLAVIDPANGRLVAQVPLGVAPAAVAAGFHSIWIANTDANSVSRIDPVTLHVVDKIDVESAPSALASGLGAMWVVNSSSGSVSRIDPDTDSVTRIQVGVAPSGVVAAHKSVWVTNSADGTVSRIDPASNTVVDRIPVGSGPSGIAAGHDIWVANSASDTVTKINAEQPSLTQTIPVGGDGPRGIAVVGADVWVSDNVGHDVARITTADGSVADLVPLEGHPDVIAAAGGHLWATQQGNGAVVEIDPETDNVVRTVPTGSPPAGIAAAGGKLWVATTTNPNAHRGGILHLVGQVDSIDPVNISGYNVDQFSVLAASYDGLVAFRHVSGADGLTIVPDLATSIPEPSPDGRSYTFQLRSDVQFSNGDPVTVNDVKRGIERAAASAGSPLQTLVVGARDCRPERCDISGVTVDQAAATVTIKLVRRSGSLLDLLANGAVAVPQGTPLAKMEKTTPPIPATGPYEIASFVPHKLIVFTPNKNFHEWSAAAQPQGFPARIEYRIVPRGRSQDAIDRVESGQADWADALEGSTNLEAYPLAELQARFGGLLRETETQWMYGVFLNTSVWPFSNLKVRKALSLAIDRSAVAEDWSAPATVTCQFLPPDFPGYRPYCPYTVRPGATTWQAADFPRAQALLKGIDVKRAPVTVWTNPGTAPSMQHVVDALTELGFNAELRTRRIKKPDYFSYVLDGRNRVQAAFMGWIGNDASASNLFSVYRCAQIQRAISFNPARYCDRTTDHLMDRADEIQATSLAQADEIWAQVQRRLVNAAPWIPLVNPKFVDVLSSTVRNFKRNPVLGVLFDQMWVR